MDQYNATERTLNPFQVSYSGHYEFVDNNPRPMHEHRGAELVLFTRGSCETRLDNNTGYLCTPEHLLLIPPGLKHIQFNNTPDCETYYTVFEGNDGLIDLTPRLIDLSGETLLQEWLLTLFRLCTEHEFEQASLLLTVAWLRLRRLEAARARQTDLHPVLERAISLLREHYAEDLSIAGLAGRCGASISLLNQLFRKQFGSGPRRYLIALRMREARSLLLNPEYNIADIARKSGFQSANYFIRQFRDFHGITPLQYRRNPDEFADRIKWDGELL